MRKLTIQEVFPEPRIIELNEMEYVTLACLVDGKLLIKGNSHERDFCKRSVLPDYATQALIDAVQSKAKEPDTWQPIETAPQDGADVLLFVPDYEIQGAKPFITIGHFQTGPSYYQIDRTPLWEDGPPAWSPGWTTDADDISNGECGFWADGMPYPPTHWMPLPAFPSLDAVEGGNEVNDKDSPVTVTYSPTVVWTRVYDGWVGKAGNRTVATISRHNCGSLCTTWFEDYSSEIDNSVTGDLAWLQNYIQEKWTNYLFRLRKGEA